MMEALGALFEPAELKIEKICRDSGDVKRLKAVLKRHPDLIPELLRYENNFTLLHLACLKNHLRVLEHLVLHEKIDPNIKALETMFSPLHVACWSNAIDCVRFLVESMGVSVNDVSKNGYTAFHYASWAGNIEILKVLIKNGAVISVQTMEGYTSLTLAVRSNKLEVVAFLMESYSQFIFIDKSDSRGCTPLHHASWEGNLDGVKLLLEFGANPLIEDVCGRNAIEMAKDRYCRETLIKAIEIKSYSRDLIDMHSRRDITRHSLLMDKFFEEGDKREEEDNRGEAADGGEIDENDEEAGRGDGLNGSRVRGGGGGGGDGGGADELNKSLSQSQEELSEGEIEQRLNDPHIDLAEFEKCLTYINAPHLVELCWQYCEENHVSKLSKLVAVYSNLPLISLRNEKNETLLMVACHYNSLDVIDFLVEFDPAHIGERDSFGYTALHHAILRGQPEAVTKLLHFTLKSELDVQSANGSSPLLKAVELGNFSIVVELVNRGADVNLCDIDGFNSLHMACYHSHYAIVFFLLLDSDVNVTALTRSGELCLDLMKNSDMRKILSLAVNSYQSLRHEPSKYRELLRRTAYPIIKKMGITEMIFDDLFVEYSSELIQASPPKNQKQLVRENSRAATKKPTRGNAKGAVKEPKAIKLDQADLDGDAFAFLRKGLRKQRKLATNKVVDITTVSAVSGGSKPSGAAKDKAAGVTDRLQKGDSLGQAQQALLFGSFSPRSAAVAAPPPAPPPPPQPSQLQQSPLLPPSSSLPHQQQQQQQQQQQPFVQLSSAQFQQSLAARQGAFGGSLQKERHGSIVSDTSHISSINNDFHSLAQIGRLTEAERLSRSRSNSNSYSRASVDHNFHHSHPQNLHQQQHQQHRIHDLHRPDISRDSFVDSQDQHLDDLRVGGQARFHSRHASPEAASPEAVFPPRHPSPQRRKSIGPADTNLATPLRPELESSFPAAKATRRNTITFFKSIIPFHSKIERDVAVPTANKEAPVQPRHSTTAASTARFGQLVSRLVLRRYLHEWRRHSQERRPHGRKASVRNNSHSDFTYIVRPEAETLPSLDLVKEKDLDLSSDSRERSIVDDLVGDTRVRIDDHPKVLGAEVPPPPHHQHQHPLQRPKPIRRSSLTGDALRQELLGETWPDLRTLFGELNSLIAEHEPFLWGVFKSYCFEPELLPTCTCICQDVYLAPIITPFQLTSIIHRGKGDEFMDINCDDELAEFIDVQSQHWEREHPSDFNNKFLTFINFVQALVILCLAAAKLDKDPGFVPSPEDIQTLFLSLVKSFELQFGELL